MKPSRYYVEYGDEAKWQAELARRGGVEEETDPANFMVERDFARLSDARWFAAKCPPVGCMAATVCERKRIRDVTPAGDPPGLLWEWDAVEVEA